MKYQYGYFIKNYCKTNTNVAYSCKKNREKTNVQVVN